MDSLRLALHGLWWRRGVSMVIVLVAATTVIAAAIAPLYARAGGESILQDTLRAAPVRDTGLEVWELTGPRGDPLRRLDAEIAASGRLGLYQHPIHSLQFSGTVVDPRNQPEASAQLAFRDRQCEHLVFLRGRCPIAVNEVAVSARSVRQHPWRLGSTLAINRPRSLVTAQQLRSLRVVGEYRPKDRNEPYWFDQDYFNAHVSAGDDPDVSDSIFTSRATFDAAPAGLAVRALVHLPLDVRAVRMADTATLRHNLAAFQRRLPGHGSAVQSISALDEVLDAAGNSTRRLDVSVLIVAGQLLVLSWFVLYLVVANATEARGPEVALAKLRGLRPAATVAFGLLEPLLLIAAATPLGLLLADLSVRALGAARLLPGTPVRFTGLTLLGAVAALAGGCLAAALAARRTLTRPVVEQWRRTSGPVRPSRVTTYADTAVALLALLGLLQLRTAGVLTNGRTNNLVLLAPGLVALAMALIGVRLLPAAARVAVRRTRGTRHLGRFLALRQVARRPAGLRVVVLLSVAFGLTTFAVAAWSVASMNRAARADTEVGAARVITVESRPGVDLVGAVRRLDPTGRYAMAVEEFLPFNDQPGGWLIAVDSGRLATVATWRGDFASTPAGTLADRLRPHTAGPVELRGSVVRLVATASALRGQRDTELWLDVNSAETGPRALSLGRIRPGPRVYAGAIPGCASGCRVTGLSVHGGLGEFTPRSGRLLFTRLSVAAATGSFRDVDAGFGRPGQWTRYTLAAPVATNDLTATPAGLALRYAADSGDVPGASPFDTPVRLPAVVTRTAVSDPTPGRPAVVTGLDGDRLPVTVVGVAGVLPRAGAAGTMLDLTYAGRVLGPHQNLATAQVWLSTAAPADVARRLSSVGLDVVSSVTAAQRIAVLGRAGPALALLLFGCAAGLAAALAAGGTAVSVFLAGRRRAFELAAMQAVGVPRSTLLRACVGEQLVLLLTGVAVGTLAGFVGAWLALPAMPIFVDDVAVPPLHYLPAPLVVGGFLVVAVAAVAATGVLAAGLLLRSASPVRLREVQA